VSDERKRRIAAAARESRAGWAILTSVDAIAYVGHVPAIEAGPSPFNGGPATAIVAPDGAMALVCNELERPAAEASGAVAVYTYESLGYTDLTPVADKYAAALRGAGAELGIAGSVAIQTESFPRAAGEALAPSVGAFVSIDRALERQRSVKTAEEIDLLRRCAEVTAVGHQASLEAARPGRTELEVFADVRCAMESAAGERLPVTGDFLSGVERTARAMGWPGDRVLQIDDPVICDLAPRVGGYWGDSCNTFVLGEPTERFQYLYETSRRAIERAAEILRPGVTAGNFDREVRAVVEQAGLRNPLHTGHGVGTSSHEWPRLVPNSPVVLQPDMVLMVEPGAYEPGTGGVRVEWMFHVTEDGSEVLSPFEFVLRPGVRMTT
jgi:Xaa-Pro dipeptidase